jgi:hypothetical protein
LPDARCDSGYASAPGRAREIFDGAFVQQKGKCGRATVDGFFLWLTRPALVAFDDLLLSESVTCLRRDLCLEFAFFQRPTRQETDLGSSRWLTARCADEWPPIPLDPETP